MVRKPVARRIEELEARKRSLMARLAARERRLELRWKMLLGTWVTGELRKITAEPDVRMLRDLLRRQLPQMALRDADRQLLEELLNGERRDENG
ncbi:mobilization protein [Agrobacterium radiobacter]|uniref:mobilization protein n=1 Tax=Agrobacterium radiobacter TaxID=362 RepID=UPI0016069F98|nr:mobilization protein [Agrobacterium radiobacter]MBB4408139.1 hypothetical protein [Agrobacterium radiobacter]MBB4453510.1 hypothetical protein [Agrobacterium radiobacter]